MLKDFVFTHIVYILLILKPQGSVKPVVFFYLCTEQNSQQRIHGLDFLCQPTPVSFPGKSHGQKSLVGYNLWGCKRVGHDLVMKQQQIAILDFASVLCCCWDN